MKSVLKVVLLLIVTNISAFAWNIGNLTTGKIKNYQNTKKVYLICQ